MSAAWVIVPGCAAVYFGACAGAASDISRTQLESELKRRRRLHWLERFDAHASDYAVTAFTWSLIMLALSVWALIAPALGRIEANAAARIAAMTAWVLMTLVIMPRAIARYQGERLLAATLPILEVFRRVTWPVLIVSRFFDEVVERLSGKHGDEENHGERIEQEILDIISEGQEKGAVGPTQSRVIRSVMDLRTRTVGEIMTPRIEIVALEVTAGVEEARRLFVEGGHSRMPVYEGTIDHILGVAYAKDLLGVEEGSESPLRSLLRSVPFVPETKILPELLREFQTSHVHIAIVLDEYGGTAGLVTFEDILEELVGEIADEHENVEPLAIRKIDEHSADVDAKVRVDELNKALGLQLPEEDAYDTVAGFVLSRFGRIPKAGETIDYDSIRIRVLDADPRRVNRVRVQPLATSA